MEKKTNKTEFRARIRSIKIPNDHVKHAALQHGKTAVELFQSKGRQVLPLYVLGGLAIELLLKSLNAEELEWDMSDLGLNQITPRAQKGHDLVRLYEGLHKDVKQELETAYAEEREIHPPGTFLEAITPFKDVFDQSRYIYERGKAIPQDVSVNVFVDLVYFLSSFVEAHPEHYVDTEGNIIPPILPTKSQNTVV